MIQWCVDAWMERKQYFKRRLESLGEDYITDWSFTYTDIVKILFEEVINPYVEDHDDFIDGYDIDKMTVIDDGDYQGTLIFVIPEDVYQPCADEYLFTHNYYGSCSGCDTLQRAQTLEYDMCIQDIMTIALNLVENLRQLYD